MRRLAVLTCLFSLLVAACSDGPSDWRIRSQVVAELSAHGADQIIEIQDFKVLNGHMKDDGTYVANVHYDIVLKQGIRRLPKELESDPKLMHTVLVLGRAMARSLLTGKSIQVGSHLPIDDDVTLARQGGEWVLQ